MSEEIKRQEMKHINISIPYEIHAKIKTLAWKNRLRMPEMIIVMIESYGNENNE